MIARILLALNCWATPFKSKSRLEGENAALKPQLLRCKGTAWRECSEILPRRLGAEVGLGGAA